MLNASRAVYDVFSQFNVHFVWLCNDVKLAHESSYRTLCKHRVMKLSVLVYVPNLIGEYLISGAGGGG